MMIWLKNDDPSLLSSLSIYHNIKLGKYFKKQWWSSLKSIWTKAMVEELGALDINQTWTVMHMCWYILGELYGFNGDQVGTIWVLIVGIPFKYFLYKTMILCFFARDVATYGNWTLIVDLHILSQKVCGM